jgi:hypothetical protein
MRKSCVAFALTAVILVVSRLACGLQAVISPAATPTPTGDPCELETQGSALLLVATFRVVSNNTMGL